MIFPHMKLEMFPQLDRNIPHVEEYILSYLQPKDLAASMLVSKEWSQRAKPLLCKCYAYIQRKNGNIPLQSAVIDGYEHLVAFFLQEKQINVNEISKRTGMTALMEVACNGKDQIAKMLLGREDIRVNMHSFKNNSPYPALHLAALYGHVGVVKLLVERSDIDVNSRGQYGSTALILALRNGQEGAVEELLKCPKIDVNVGDKDGLTALSMAKHYLAHFNEMRPLEEKAQKIVEKLEKLIEILEKRNAI